MRKIKWFMIILILTVSMVFGISRVNAEDTTPLTTTTTESTDTTDNVATTEYSVDFSDTYEKLQLYIKAGVIYLLSSGVLASLLVFAFAKVKRELTNRVLEAKRNNEISAETADKATTAINATMTAIDNKMADFQSSVGGKIDNLDTNVKDMINKIDVGLGQYVEILEEYLSNTEE